MPSQETVTDETTQLDYEPDAEDQDWLEEPEQPSRRPRRRLLAPVPIALLAVLLIACGFFAGVKVEKGQTGSSGAASGLPAGLAALRGGAAATGAAPSGGTSSARGSGSAGGFPGASGSGGGLTVGEVSSVRGNTLYVANSQGNTIKVAAPAGVKVTKTVSTKAKSIHPGDTVTVVGSQGKNGSVNASSISVSSSTSSATGTTSPTGSGASGGGASALFGSG